MDDDVKLPQAMRHGVHCRENFQMIPFSRGMLTGAANRNVGQQRPATGRETEKRKGEQNEERRRNDRGGV